MKRNPSRSYITPRVSPARIDERQDKKTTIPRQTRVVRSTRHMLSTESLGTAAQKSGQSVESNGTDMVRKMTRMNPPWSCRRILSDATGPPDGETMHQSPSELESG